MVLVVIALLVWRHHKCRTLPPTFGEVFGAFNKQSSGSQEQAHTNAPDAEALTQKYDKAPDVELQPQRPVQDADIYVNLSQSMRGFVAGSKENSRISPNSNYCRVLEMLFKRMSTQGYTVRSYRFSSRSMVKERNIFFDPAQYTEGPVSLAEILEQLVDPTYDPKRLTLITSDMVGSGIETGPGGRDPAACFRELRDRHARVLLLGFRSAYEGTYRAAAMTCLNHQLQMAANQSLPGSGRPFYILVIAPGEPSLRELRKKVLDQLQGRVLLDPSSSALPLESGEAPPQPYIELVDETRREEGSDSTLRFYTQLAVHQETKLRFEWVTTKDIEDDPSQPSLIDRTKLETQVRSLFVDCGGKLTSPKPDQLPLQVKQEPNGDLIFEYVVRPPDTYPWIVFQVKLLPGTGNLQQPRRAKAWSTPDDCTTARVRNTYQLDLLGDALSSSFVQETVFAEHYIAIRRD